MIGKFTSLLTLLVLAIVLNSLDVESHKFKNKNLSGLQQFKKVQRIIKQRKIKNQKTTPITSTPTKKPTSTTTTTTPTTTTTAAPSPDSIRIRNQYEFGRNITRKFDFSLEEALKRFESRIDKQIIPKFETCKKPVPFYKKKQLDKVAKKLQNLVQKISCSNGRIISSSIDKKHKRHRRMTATCLEKVQNADGSESCVVMCREQGSITNQGFIQSCTECDVITTLRSDM